MAEPETLVRYLAHRAIKSYIALLSEIDGIDSPTALRYSDPYWPDHRWGVGQNGSIAGIVYHVAAWKQMTLPLFEAGGRPHTREEFDATSAPDAADWPEIVDWLKRVGAAWNARMQALTEAEWNTCRDWEGHPMPITSFVSEMMEHDVQHASQIAYIKQRCEAEDGESYAVP